MDDWSWELLSPPAAAAADGSVADHAAVDFDYFSSGIGERTEEESLSSSGGGPSWVDPEENSGTGLAESVDIELGNDGDDQMKERSKLGASHAENSADFCSKWPMVSLEGCVSNEQSSDFGERSGFPANSEIERRSDSGVESMNERKKGEVWSLWRLLMKFSKIRAPKARLLWALPVVTVAMLGLTLLLRWHFHRRKRLGSVPVLRLLLDEKKASHMKALVARHLNSASSPVRPSAPATNIIPWPATSFL